MWLFLLTEILLFGGLFMLYAVFRSKHAGEFHKAAEDLNRIAGTANTVVLLTSSLAMALSIAAIRISFSGEVRSPRMLESDCGSSFIAQADR